MPTEQVRIGVPQIFLSVDSSTAVPTCAALAYTASAQSYTETLNNDTPRGLSTTDTYQVMIGLVGRR